jgi:hypothetical protein
MMKCPQCSSHRIQSRGIETTSSGDVRRRYQCRNCNKWFSRYENKNKFEPTTQTKFEGFTKFVITAVQNNCSVNWDFYQALKNYCEINSAKLLLVPFKHKIPGDASEMWDRFEVPEEELFRQQVRLHPKLRLLGDININPAIENPINGLDYLSKGDSLVIAHAQLAMKTLAVNSVDTPAIITTTGTVTEPRYTRTKQGLKGKFNHSFSAVVIELDGEDYHYRVLNADENNGFYDVNGYYTKDSHETDVRAEALITGDEHAMFICPKVKAATYTDVDSIVNTLKPKKLVRHDVLDFFSGSHHHAKSFLTKYAKYEMGTNKIEDELKLTMKHIAETTPSFAENVLVASNHNEHLHQWLDTTNPKDEPWNAKLYHRLMYLMLDAMQPDGNAFKYPSAFRLWAENTKFDFPTPKISWLDRNMSYKICDIELSNHGDMGINGSRGSATQFARLAHKMVVGHSHSPSIMKGAYTVGTSTGRLEYARGPSGWMRTHCLIWPNGKRQLINIIGGKWRA